LNCAKNKIPSLDLSNNTKLVDIVKKGLVDYHKDPKVNYYAVYNPEDGCVDFSVMTDTTTQLITDNTKIEYMKEWVNGTYYNSKGKSGNSTGGVWEKGKLGWWYQYHNNTLDKDTYIKKCWAKIDGVWYYFNKNGYMASNEYYYGYWLNNNGSWTYEYRASWKKNNNGWWYGDDSGWYARKCWLKIDGNWYYFDSNGYMVTGKVTFAGKTYTFNKDGVWVK